MSLLGVCFCVFLILKLTSLIDWSWWWVLSPLWLPLAGVLCVALIGYIFGGKKWNQ
ncbi:MAG: hypothetical protein J6R99_01880 [Alphaproteobacteria bacterium]|nr:hypothetical protein [Alphaproteobacteria bacterium]